MQKRRPNPNEYGAYYQGYISQVEGDDAISLLEKNKKEIADFFRNIPADKWEYKYAPDKWTPKDLLLHLIDQLFDYQYNQIIT